LDQKGQSRSLASLTGPKGLMLVFYRSADWCPYCKTQLAELQARTADLANNGIGLAAVSYDPVLTVGSILARLGNNLDLRYRLRLSRAL
jgi:peroxiredoxin